MVLAPGVTWNAALFHWEGSWGVGGGGWAIPYPLLSKWASFYVVRVLDSHYAGSRVTGCGRWQRRSSPIAQNTGV